MSDFSFEHTNLTPEQVRAAILAAPVATGAASFAGKKISLILDGGEALVMSFSGDGSAVTAKGIGTFVENVGFSVLELNSMTMIAYSVPEALTSFVAVYDSDSKLATVYELWFCGEFGPAREVCRQVYHGYLTGWEVPRHRPSPTKRLVGKAVRWTSDAGSSLAIYATFMFSSFVPVGSDQTFTAPTDYFEFNHHTYLYSRCEIDFSGELVLEVFDLHSMKLIGVRVGFNKADEFGFNTYTATGKVLGQFAAYGPFGADYDLPPVMMRPGPDGPPPPATPPKGARVSYRPSVMTHKMTLEEVYDAATRAGSWTGAFSGPGKEKRCMPNSDMLKNREFTVKFGDKAFSYKIAGKFDMQFKLTSDGEWKSERYEAFEADENLAFFTHSTNGLAPVEIYQYALDFTTGLATCLISRMNNEDYTREATQEWLFGYISGGSNSFAPTTERHGFTDELVGTSFTWTYGDNMFSQHIYSTAESYSWSIFMNNIPGMMWSSPCKYVKIRDGVYMMSWIEHRSQGIQGTYLFNTKTMHDCGTCLGVAHNQIFEYNTFGAEARSAGVVKLD